MKLNILSILVVLVLVACGSKDKKDTVKLWYDAPAKEWMESLPLGNGRVGVMVYGGVEKETLALNESTLWSGQYDENMQRPFGRQRLDELRQMFFDGKIGDANYIAGQEMAGTPHSQGTHLPMGDLHINFTYPDGELTDYYRDLNLENAISTVTYTVGNVQYTRECIATNPDDVIALNIKASKKGAINMEISLDLLRNAEIHTHENKIIYSGNAKFRKHGPGGVLFEGCVAVATKDGTIRTTDKTLVIENATEVKLVTDIRTNFTNTTFAGYGDYKAKCHNAVDAALKKDFKTIVKSHVNDYTPLFERVKLTLGTNNNNNNTPTNERWTKVKKGTPDPGLDALFFQYARYLLISASRPNSPLPVALQGFYNDNLACHMGWTNDYHLDINTQQNYWISNVGNLAECNLPLFDFIKDLSVHGAKTANDLYGCTGWVAHVTANVWGYTAVSGSILWGLSPTCSSWLASHLWTQYEYTQDKDYLANVAYPLLKSHAEFLIDYMVINPNNGYLMTGPSISPENSFLYDGIELCASLMPTCDRVLTHEIFSYCIQISDILDIDHVFANSLKEAISKMPPLMISEKNGGLQEWFEDYDEAHPNHRHTTHLLALYPYSQITIDKTPELAEASRKTIENRLSTPDWEDTEWSRANMICFYARLRDAKLAYESVQILLSNLTRENLLSISPAGIAGAPYDIFIFDGNAAGAAGIAEMLLQSHDGHIAVLPCLPKEWKDGSYEKLCARGGVEVSANWKNSEIQNVTLHATADSEFILRFDNKGNYTEIIENYNYTFKKNNKEFTPNIVDDGVKIQMKKGDIITADINN